MVLDLNGKSNELNDIKTKGDIINQHCKELADPYITEEEKKIIREDKATLIKERSIEFRKIFNCK